MIKKVEIITNMQPQTELEKAILRVFNGVVTKLNEVVDAINKLETMAKNTNTVLKSLVEENNIHEKQIDELQMKLEPHKCEPAENTTISKMENVDPYAEQRKWIGCLVEYGNADDGFRYGILTNIEPIFSAYPFEIDNGRNATANCWLPSKTIFYKGGDNE